MQKPIHAIKLTRSIGYITLVSIILSLITLKPIRQVNAEEIGNNAAQKNNLGTISKDLVKNLNLGSLTSTTVSSHLNTNADWSTWFIPLGIRGNHLRFMVDINGDGLPDYIILTRNRDSNGYVHFTDRVYLGKGHGWKLAYSCDYSQDLSGDRFIGDCALESYTGSNSQLASDGVFSNYTSWPNSTGYAENDWNLPFYINTPLNDEGWLENMIDLNGDGLADYIYKENFPYKTWEKVCICLNNGHGWDVTYKCVRARADDNYIHYYGDCADLGGQNIKQSGLNLKEDAKVETNLPEK